MGDEHLRRLIGQQVLLAASDPSLFVPNENGTDSSLNTNQAGGFVWDLSVSVGQVTSSSSLSESSNARVDNHSLRDPKESKNYIVDPCSGVLENGKVCGILGPSGSGKTSFLLALAGFLPQSAVDGYALKYQMNKNDTATTTPYNNITLESMLPNEVAWLQQHVDFFTQLTVRETLELAAYLELPHMSRKDRIALVQKTVESLGLQKTLDRQIGEHDNDNQNFHGTDWSVNRFVQLLPSSFRRRNSSTSGIPAGGGGGRLSGGERRRLSVALELLANNQLVFLADEPTSGLDSRMSVIVMNLIRKLARERNIPAFCSLHQPRSSIWQELDSILLMAQGGKICYYGDRDKIMPYFQKLGYALPNNTNPAEYLIDLVSVDSEDPLHAKRDTDRINEFAELFASHQEQQYSRRMSDATLSTLDTMQILDNSKSSIKSIDEPTQSSATASVAQTIWDWFLRVGALLKRSFRQNTRDIKMIIIFLLFNIGDGILLTGIFPKVRGTIPLAGSISDRLSLLSFSAINLGMSGFMKSVTLFAREKSIIKREQRRGQYSPAEYLIAKVLAEMPIDCLFAFIFTITLKHFSGIMIRWESLVIAFSVFTTASASLGFLLGSLAPSEKAASAIGIPIVVVLMVVGVINPSGIDPSKPSPSLVRALKIFSPFAFVIEALCLGEYPGVIYQYDDDISTASSPRGFRFGQRWFSRLKDMKRMGGLALVDNGDQVIEALGLKEKTFYGALQNLAVISAGNLIISWLCLMWQRRKDFPNRRERSSPPRTAVDKKDKVD